jgi:predicted small metal-binding protein
LKVSADSDDEAVEKLMKEGEEHIKNVHPEMKTDASDMKKEVEANMKKEGGW